MIATSWSVSTTRSRATPPSRAADRIAPKGLARARLRGRRVASVTVSGMASQPKARFAAAP
jgi:hypothetical protein